MADPVSFAAIFTGLSAAASTASTIKGLTSGGPKTPPRPSVPTIDQAANNADAIKKQDEANRKRAGRESTRKKQVLTSDTQINRPKLTLGA